LADSGSEKLRRGTVLTSAPTSTSHSSQSGSLRLALSRSILGRNRVNLSIDVDLEEHFSVTARSSHRSRYAHFNDRPWIFGLLIAPSAVLANGIVQGGVLVYLLTQQGMKIDVASHWLTILALPTSLYFLYSPLTDFLLKRRTWLIVGSLCAAALMLLAFQQKTIAAPSPLRLIVLAGCLSQLVVASCGGMMGTLHSDRSRKAASSFYQAGGMTFGALATWLLIRESSRVRKSAPRVDEAPSGRRLSVESDLWKQSLR